MKHLVLKLKKSRTQATSFIVGGLTTSLLFFNNCGGPMGDTQPSTSTQTGSSTQQSTRAPSGSTASVPGIFLGSSSQVAEAASSSSSNTGAGASYGTAPTGVTSSIGSPSSGSSANTASSSSLYSCSKGTSASDLTVSVSHSPNGPWVVGGQICKGQTGYFKVSGLPAGAIVKGCASPAASRDCFDISKHRDYLASERRSNGDIITVASAAETAAWPAGVYHFYNGAGNSSRMVIDLVGKASLVNCSGSSSSGSSGSTAPVSCFWDVENPTFVVGGGNNVPPSGLPCTSASHAGTRGTGYYDMGGGNRTAQGMICRCQ